MVALFPSGVALGDAFYDREQERKQLIQQIDHTRHTVLIAPRRFGKTSLMRKVLSEKAYPHLWVDFMTMTSVEDVQEKLLEHISELIVTLGGTEKKIRQLVTRFLSALQPELTIGANALITLKLKPKHTVQNNLIEALVQLDAIAQHMKKRAVIICDEFQEISKLESGSALQGAIRHAAERAQMTTYLFSGSKHRPLRRLFNGKQNPLYELCEQMTLTRVSEAYYRTYLTSEAKKRWGYPLNETLLDKIFTYTECYPKYVNALCGKLWDGAADPSPELLDVLWDDYIFHRKNGIRDELDALKLNERKVLQHLCFHPTNTPYSKQVLSEVNLSQATIQRALETLLNKDLVIDVEGTYRVLDPTYRYYFQRF